MSVTDDDDKDVLKGVTNVVEEEENNQDDGRVKGHVGVNGYETPEINKISSSALDQKELQVVTQKLTPEQIAFVMEILNRKAPFDVIPIKQLFYGMCSAFTKTPTPHNVNSKDAGAGKSYLLSHVGGFFPAKYVSPMTGMSDKAIFHRPGIMVIEQYDDENGGVELIPISPIIRKLELEKAEIQEEKQTGYNQRIKEIDYEIKDLYDKAEKLIDLNNQIILGLDTPQDSLFDAIMALMSQDFPGDQKYEYAEKSSSGKMGRKVNRLRGMPVLFTSRVIDDTRAPRFSEKNRRFINVNPVTSSKKIHAANEQIALTYGSLPEEYDRLLVSRQDTERCRQIIEIIVAKLKHHSTYLNPKESGILIPFHDAISKCIPVSENQPWSMTVTERSCKYLSIITKINMDNRPRIVDTKTGQFWPIATFEDLKEALVLMERAASGVRPYIANWYNDVFVTAFKDLDGKPNELKDQFGNIIDKERHVGVTTEQLAEKTKSVYGGLKPSSGDLLYKYLYPLINQGIVDKVPSEIDKRFNLFLPVEATTGGSNIFALFQDPDDIRLKSPFPNAYPTKNIIEDSTRFSLEHYYKEGVGNERKYRLIDVDGKEISPKELAKKYYSSPEDCFIKDDETLNAENMARSIVSVSNHLYSQNIQHKITPFACNNILTDLYNNPIEVSRSKAIQKYSTAAIAIYNNPLKKEPQENTTTLGTNKIDANQQKSSGPYKKTPYREQFVDVVCGKCGKKHQIRHYEYCHDCIDHYWYPFGEFPFGKTKKCVVCGKYERPYRVDGRFMCHVCACKSDLKQKCYFCKEEYPVRDMMYGEVVPTFSQTMLDENGNTAFRCERCVREIDQAGEGEETFDPPRTRRRDEDEDEEEIDEEEGVDEEEEA
jgi:hypothetical protein